MSEERPGQIPEEGSRQPLCAENGRGKFLVEGKAKD